jgi:acyl carrier protein
MDQSHAHEVILDVLAGIAPEVDPATVDPTAELQVEFDLDSLDFLNLVEGVSKAAGFDIPERDYPSIATLSDFTDYLVRTAT